MDGVVHGGAKSRTWLSMFHSLQAKSRLICLSCNLWAVQGWFDSLIPRSLQGPCHLLLSLLSGLRVTLSPTFQAEGEGVIKWIGEEPWMLMVGVLESLNCVRLFAAPWTATRQASLSLTVSWFLPNFTSIESMMPSDHLILCRPLLLLPSVFPSIRVFSSESALRIRWLKYWSFSISPSSECSGLIFFRTDWFDLDIQGTLKSSLAPQFESIRSLALMITYLAIPASNFMCLCSMLMLLISDFPFYMLSFNFLCGREGRRTLGVYCPALPRHIHPSFLFVSPNLAI